RSELLELTGGRGPDECIEAVGMEATHGSAPIDAYDRAKHATRTESERTHALSQAIMCCRNGGVVSVIGDYGGLSDKLPAGSWMNRSLVLPGGECDVQRSMKPPLERLERGQIQHTPGCSHKPPLQHARARD